MKRLALVACAGLLLLGLVPGSALAITPTNNLDQSNDPGGDWGGGQTMAQTFTAGKTGALSKVGLSLANNGSETVAASIEGVNGSSLPNGTIEATSTGVLVSGSSYNANAWYYFSFTPPVSVVSGTQYAIVLTTTSVVWHSAQANPYPAGVALSSGGGTAGPWSPIAPVTNDDFGFRTYVDTVVDQLSWDKPQITGGVSTPLTLTAVITYANGAEADHYGPLLGLVPTWFNATGITCADTAGKIVPADCTLANFGAGFGSLIPASATGDILTLTVTGTAAPTLANVGTAGLAGSNACIVYVAPPAPGVQPAATTLQECSDGTATVQVVAAAATPAPTHTPPPTATGAGRSSDGSGGSIWLLPIGMLAFLGGMLALSSRRRSLNS